MTIGVKYIAYPNASGYGLAGVAYVRALHNAGVPVWWQPWFLGGEPHLWTPGDGLGTLPLAQAAEGWAALADLPSLIATTMRPIEYDTVVVHVVPEHWPRLVEPAKRMLGYTVWETDALPRHWPAILNAMSAIAVPSRMNGEIFRHDGVSRPVHVVPHIRRHAWSETARDDAVKVRIRLRIPEDHFVFYTIGAWDPRKAFPELVDAFAHEFRAEERVSLLVKTSAALSNAAVDTQFGAGTEARTKRIVAEAARATGRAAAAVTCIAADNIDGRSMDAIHAAGDAYVSLAHGEGWGLGAFEAATLGKPVIMTGWGGQLDYLGADYPGLVRYGMTPVTGWLPYASYQPAQLWADADAQHARELMRAAAMRDGRLRDAAVSAREAIVNRFAEPVVAREFIAAIDG
jgi:glycosyltransferase involved in cell wall biosynthesis